MVGCKHFIGTIDYWCADSYACVVTKYIFRRLTLVGCFEKFSNHNSCNKYSCLFVEGFYQAFYEFISSFQGC